MGLLKTIKARYFNHSYDVVKNKDGFADIQFKNHVINVCNIHTVIEEELSVIGELGFDERKYIVIIMNDNSAYLLRDNLDLDFVLKYLNE